jgi:hypothetical protein
VSQTEFHETGEFVMGRSLLGMMAVVCLTAGAGLALDDYRNTWTVADQLRDPVGFTEFARRQLTWELRQLRTLRPPLQVELQRLMAEEERIKSALDFAANLTERLREEPTAVVSEDSSVIPDGRTWGRAERMSQVSSLISQMEGYENDLERIHRYRLHAEEELQRLTRQESETESNLQLLATCAQTLRTVRDAQPNTELMSNVELLMVRNKSVLQRSAE